MDLVAPVESNGRLSDQHWNGSTHAYQGPENVSRSSDKLNLTNQPSGDAKYRQLDKIDAQQQVNLEARNESPRPSSESSQGKTVIAFSHDDKDNPHNWSSTRKAMIIVTGVIIVLNSTMGTSIPSGAVPFIAADFHVPNQEQLVLPTSIYLVGYIFGPLLWGPLSETYGRKPIIVSTFFLFTTFTLGCALAPNWPAFLIFRLIVGINASCPLTVVGGVCADTFKDPVPRGRAIAIFMASTNFGPPLGGVISGYASVITWQWSFWVALIVAGVSWLPLILMPETYAPIILQNRAKRLRKDTGNHNVYAPIELDERTVTAQLMIISTRAIRMLFFEPIVLSSSLYMSLAYAIFFMFFQAYPVIFQGTYHFSLGEEGLAFIPIAIGSVMAYPIYVCWDYILLRAKRNHRSWADSEEYRRLPLSLIGGPLFVVSLFWLGWTATPQIHWIIPILAGLLFGIGFLLIFMSLINYLVDAYDLFAASALAAATCSRSTFGVVLPFAAVPMYERLGVGWACSLLGFASAVMCIIPFAFIKYGDQIRAKSTFCQQLAEEKRKKAAEDERRAAKHRTAQEKV